MAKINEALPELLHIRVQILPVLFKVIQSTFDGLVSSIFVYPVARLLVTKRDVRILEITGFPISFESSVVLHVGAVPRWNSDRVGENKRQEKQCRNSHVLGAD